MEKRPWKVICLKDLTLTYKAGGPPVFHCTTEVDAKEHIKQIQTFYKDSEWDVVYRDADSLKTYDAIQDQMERAILDASRRLLNG